MRGAAIAGLLRENLVDAPPREAATQNRIDRVMIEGGVIAGPGIFRMCFPESLHRPPQHAPRPQLREILSGG